VYVSFQALAPVNDKLMFCCWVSAHVLDERSDVSEKELPKRGTLAYYATQKPNKIHLTTEIFKQPAIIALGILLSTATNSVKNQTVCPLNQITEE
jgi:hypothetical protein